MIALALALGIGVVLGFACGFFIGMPTGMGLERGTRCAREHGAGCDKCSFASKKETP